MLYCYRRGSKLEPYIAADNVSFSYPAPPGEPPVTALDGADLWVHPGEFVAVVGPNGSGKSTLARLCNVLLTPSDGHVLVDGMDTRDPAHLWPIRDRVGMVFQNPDNQIVAAVVEEDVAFGPENQALHPEEIRARVEEALGAVGLSPLRHRPPHMLSGGQKQRLAIAGALALRPACLILDEPTAMLDPKGRAEVLHTVQRLNRTAGISVVWITHFMEEAVQADRVLVMRQGKVALAGPPAGVFSQSEQLRAASLDVPPAVAMAEQFRRRGVPVPAGVLTLEQLVDALATSAPAPAVGWANGGEPGQAAGGALPVDGVAATMEPLIALEGVTHVYNRGTPVEWKAIEDVSVRIGKGEFWGIIGSTGSGKSTLVQHFNRLLKPAEGRVSVQGMDLAQRGADLLRVRQQVGLVFQYPEQQLFAATVHEEVAYGPRNLGLPADEVDRRVHHALKAVGLPTDLLGRSPFTLSGGQARRLALAGVLAMRPSALVLDEPAAGLDPKGRRDILGLVQELHRSGLTIILVSHSMDDVAELAQQVLVLHKGRVAMQGAPRDLFQRGEELEAIGLGLPAAARLVRDLRFRGWLLPARALTVDEAVAEVAAALGQGGGDLV